MVGLGYSVAMTDDMTAALNAHHRHIEEGIREIAAHCSRAAPDISGLSAARVRLSRASAARTRYINDIIIPALLEGADPALRAKLGTIQKAFSAKRLASSEHVSTWTSKSIEADWEGYRAASRTIRAMMEEQIDRERSVLLPGLKNIGS